MSRISSTTFKWLFWSWLIIIFVSSSIPWLGSGNIILSIPVTEVELELRSDYFLHSFMYFILITFFMLWRKQWVKENFLLSLVSIMIVSVGISFLEECYQLMIPGRVYNINDFIFNVFGVIIGIVFSVVVISSKKSERR